MSLKTVSLTVLACTVILCVYYVSYTGGISGGIKSDEQKNDVIISKKLTAHRQPDDTMTAVKFAKKELQMCPKLLPAEADINTVDVFRNFDFQVGNNVTKEKNYKTSFCSLLG